jgi:hypothetical protein
MIGALDQLAIAVDGRTVVIDPTHTAHLTGATANADASRLELRMSMNARGEGSSTWQLVIQLDAVDLQLLREGDSQTIDAYRKVVEANIAEWWHTGSTLVVIDARKTT